jgi:predicted AAA+ superfamily ATPase
VQYSRENEENDIYYWTNDNSIAEVDFVIQNDNEIIPIEVKSGTNLQSVSFKLFCEKYKPAKAIRTSLADYKEETWMTNVPLYAMGIINSGLMLYNIKKTYTKHPICIVYL